MAWHDGLDIEALLALEGEEKEKAENLLLDGLVDSVPDYRLAVGLGELRSQKALPVLKEKLNQATGELHAHIAAAVAKIEGTEGEGIDNMIEALKAGYFQAALDLKRFNTPKVTAALFEAVENDAYLVRYHSCESLLHLHGLPSAISDYGAIFGNIVAKEMDHPTPEEKSKFKTAVLQLKKLFQKKIKD